MPVVALGAGSCPVLQCCLCLSELEGFSHLLPALCHVPWEGDTCPHAMSQTCSCGHWVVFCFSWGFLPYPASRLLGGSKVADRGVSAWQGLHWVPGAWRELLLLQRCLWASGVSWRWLLIKCLGSRRVKGSCPAGPDWC